MLYNSNPRYDFSIIKQSYIFFVQDKLEPNLAKRAEHYFSENMRVMKGIFSLIALINFILRAQCDLLNEPFLL